MYSLILINNWREATAPINMVLYLISWSSVIIGGVLAVCCGFLLRTKNRNVYRNDGIDWRDEFAHRRPWLPATVMATLLICTLPLSADYIKGQQQFVNNWHDPKSITHPKNVSLTINYDHDSKKLAQEKNSNWHQIKKNKIKVTMNGKIIPVTETIAVNKFRGQVTWQVQYTNGHITNNKTYSKVLENMYALTKTGARTAQITIASDLDSNIQNSRNSLKNALSELQFVG
jgi:hypothetical protein